MPLSCEKLNAHANVGAGKEEEKAIKRHKAVDQYVAGCSCKHFSLSAKLDGVPRPLSPYHLLPSCIDTWIPM